MDKALSLLQEATFEIKRLRNDNQLMRTRLDMFDDMMTIFNTEPNRKGYGMSPDIAKEIEKFIESNKPTN